MSRILWINVFRAADYYTNANDEDAELCKRIHEADDKRFKRYSSQNIAYDTAHHTIEHDSSVG